MRVRVLTYEVSPLLPGHDMCGTSRECFALLWKKKKKCPDHFRFACFTHSAYFVSFVCLACYVRRGRGCRGWSQKKPAVETDAQQRSSPPPFAGVFNIPTQELISNFQTSHVTATPFLTLVKITDSRFMFVEPTTLGSRRCKIRNLWRPGYEYC